MYAKTIVEMSRPDISPALYAKLLAYHPTSASVEWSFSMLKSMIHENRNFIDAHVAFHYKRVCSCSKYMFRLTYEMITENSINLLF